MAGELQGKQGKLPNLQLQEQQNQLRSRKTGQQTVRQAQSHLPMAGELQGKQGKLPNLQPQEQQNQLWSGQASQ